MKRFLRMAKLNSEERSYYIERHSNPPEALIEALKASNIRNYSIAEKGDTLISYFEYVGQDFESDMNKLNENEASIRWNADMEKCFESALCGSQWVDFDEVFYMS